LTTALVIIFATLMVISGIEHDQLFISFS